MMITIKNNLMSSIKYYKMANLRYKRKMIISNKKSLNIINKNYRSYCSLTDKEDQKLSHTEAVEMLIENEIIPKGRASEIYKKVNSNDFIFYEKLSQDSTEVLREEEKVDHWILSSMSMIKSIHSLDNLNNGSKVLDIGCGTGLTSTILAYIVKPDGLVIGVDIDESSIEFARKIVNTNYTDVKDNIQFIHADAKYGYPEHAPYDAIFVGGCVEEIPISWFDQLKIGGSIVVATMERDQEVKVLRRYIKTGNDTYERENILNVNYEYIKMEPNEGSNNNES